MHLLLCLFVFLATGVHDATFAQVTLAPGDIVVAEEFGVAPDLPGVVRVDPVTGAQAVFAAGPPFVNPLGLAFEASGDFDCDGNLCTVGDYCNSTTKACVSGARLLPAGSACNDGNACSAGDQCSSAGACLGTPIPDGQACDDRNGCTAIDQCVIGVCGGITLPDTTPCDDGNRCTLDALDRCQRGACTGGPKKDCSLSTLFSPRCQPATGLCCGKISKKGSTVVCR